MRRGNWLRLLIAQNPHQWYVYRAMGQTYLETQNDRFRMESKNQNGWQHESRGRDGKWRTDEEWAHLAREEARRMGWIR